MAENAPNDPSVHPRRLLTILAIFTILLGLVFLYSSPGNAGQVFPPHLWIVLAGIVLLIANELVPPGRRLKKHLPKWVFPQTIGWVLFSLMLSALAAVTMLAFSKGGRANYLPVLTFWLAGGLGYLSAFHPAIFSLKKWKAWFVLHKRELLWLALVMFIGALIRFYRLGSAPFIINGDEGRMGLMAQATNAGELANPYALRENFGALYLLMVDMCFELFGANAFSLRLLPALSGILAIPALYLLARKIAGRQVALISAALLAFSHTHMHFSRTGTVGYIHSTWLVPLELYFLFTGIDRRSSWRSALAGILLAIHFSIYLTSQVVVVLLLIFMVIAFLAFRSWLKPAWRQVLVFWGGLGIMLIPEAVYVLQFPNRFFERLRLDGTFQSGWLEMTMASTGKDAIQLLAERVLHAFLALFYYPAYDFYGSPIPMLSLIAAMLFLVGLVLFLIRRQNPGSLLLNGYFWGFTLAVGIFSIPPSADSYRMLITLPAAYIMAGSGFNFIMEMVGLGWATARRTYAAVATFTVLSLLVFNMWTYFDDFIGHCIYGDDLQGRFASHLGTYVSTIENPRVPVYLLSDGVYFYGSHASAQFLAQNRSIINFPDPMDGIPLESGAVIIANPARIEELEEWARLTLAGEVQYQYDCQTPILAFYQVP